MKQFSHVERLAVDRGKKQKCGDDDDERHDYLLMKPVSRISNQARWEEDGQCPREEKKRTEVKYTEVQTAEGKTESRPDAL